MNPCARPGVRNGVRSASSQALEITSSSKNVQSFTACYADQELDNGVVDKYACVCSV